MLTEKQSARCRLLIFERDALIRDTCAQIADRFDCDLYSSAYIDNFATIVERFRPTGLVIDVDLLENNGIELLLQIVKDVPYVSLLFLAGDNAVLAETAEKLARSIGLHVEGNLQKPVDKPQLEESVRRMAEQTPD